MDVPERSPPASVPLIALFLVCCRLGAISFGGGVLAWLHREIVVRRRWLDDQDYLASLGIATILPGPNPVNVAVHVGMKLRGAMGALVAALGLILPAFCLILSLGIGYAHLRAFPITGVVLGGLAASGVGTSLSNGTRLALRLPRRAATLLIAALVFAASAFLRWPVALIIAVAAPAAILTSYVSGQRR